ncbi:MAG: sigma-70 family RNA polymerase sigma factor [Oscillospiraceae bacterium]|nr:sigma-70 family RNA polymerase sigma factor [Oscillospiraceae bacterium]MDD6146767.1 sigma-70 family RNA polymerase sigma factor [Oscillospiraceae bacterium]
MKDSNKKRDEYIDSNYGLVHSCANKFRGRGVEYDDLFQAGCVGLIKAADHFDESRGFAFSTYAVPVILGEIKRIFRDGGTLKIGRSLKEKSRHAMKVKDELAMELGREPTISELAEKLGIEVSAAAELVTVSMPIISLTAEDEKGTVQIDVPTEAPEEAISERLALRSIVSSLEERDRRLIELRYFKGLTQMKTAEELGMSQVQVSRREKAILIYMRKSMSL